MRNKILIGFGFLLILSFVNGASAETFKATFPETCIGCLDDVAPEADPVINAISLPAGRVKLTIDTKVSPYRGLGSVTCVHGFLYSDLSADLKVWPDSYTGLVQGTIIESEISPCPEGGEHREHFVTMLKLKEPIENFKIAIPPSIIHNNLGPKYQYGQKKEISISWEGAGDCPITGKYAWFNGNTVYIRPDGTMETWTKEGKLEMRGTWTKSGETYFMNWTNDATGDKYYDKAIFSDDCKNIYGSSSIGISFSATRISDISDNGNGEPVATIPITPIETAPKVTDTTTISPTPTFTPIVISDTWNKAFVYNNPYCKPSFTISEPHTITYIDTYHWNDGKGTSTGGTISLKRDDGTIYGPWKVETKPGMGGVPNALWIVHPNEVMPAGTYTVEDSDIESWSHNQGSNGCGFSKIEGRPYTQMDTPISTSTINPTKTLDHTSINPTPTTITSTINPTLTIPATTPNSTTNISAPGIVMVICIIFVIYGLNRLKK